MIRKSILALAAVAALGAAALAPTSASAGGKFFHKHHHHLGVGFGFYPRYYAPYDCFWTKKLTPFGVRFVKVCSHW
jgi:hypothetical protein